MKDPATSNPAPPKHSQPAAGGEAPVPNESKGGESGTHPIIERLPILVSPTTSGKGKNTIRMELIPLACWKLNDVRFAFGSSFVLPESKSEFLELSQLRKKHPGAPLSVFGHADPAGEDSFNKKLSGHRADAIYGVLIRDTARWEELYLAGGKSESWGAASIQAMLEALQFYGGPVTGTMNPRSREAVERFQGISGLRADGVPGPQTRAKLFAAYMDFLCPEKLSKTEFLAKGADAGGKGDVQGCGEFNPVMLFSTAELQTFSKSGNNSSRDAANEINRRVMVLLFRPGSDVSPDKWPCPRTSEGVEGCRRRFWSDGEHRRSSQSAHREFSVTQDTFACRFYHRLVISSPCEGIVPVPTGPHWIEILLRDEYGKPAVGVPYRITFPDGKSVSGHLDKTGRARYADIPPGKCDVTFPEIDGTEWSLAR